MNIDDSETSEKRYTLRPTFTPLPSKDKMAGKSKNPILNAESSSKAGSLTTGKSSPNRVTGAFATGKAKTSSNAAIGNGLIRAANEDDDLYDPYSDYHDGTLKAAEFEEDPWH